MDSYQAPAWDKASGCVWCGNGELGEEWERGEGGSWSGGSKGFGFPVFYSILLSPKLMASGQSSDCVRSKGNGLTGARSWLGLYGEPPAWLGVVRSTSPGPLKVAMARDLFKPGLVRGCSLLWAVALGIYRRFKVPTDKGRSCWVLTILAAERFGRVPTVQGLVGSLTFSRYLK